MTNVFLNGCNGRMGKTIVQFIEETEDIKIVAGADIAEMPKSGSPAESFSFYNDAMQVKEDFDVIVDFSHVSGLSSILELAEKTRKPLVLCTTGFSETDKEKIRRQSENTPVFYSANMSLGINLLISLVQKAASVLYPDFDVEIIEAHHNQKLDAPSGTALMIGDAIHQTLDQKMEYVYDRHSQKKKREKNEIGFHAIRGGSITGDHSVVFAGQEEVFTISHHAQSRGVFARGAIAAAKFMANKKPGLYEMKDLVE